MTVKNIKPETLVVTKELLKSVRSARIRDDEYLGNQKKEESLSEKENKLEAITANIVPIEKKFAKYMWHSDQRFWKVNG